MAAKDITLKKRLVKEGIIGLVVLAVLAGAGILLSGYDDDAQSEKQNRENESGGIRAEHDSIVHELSTGFEVGTFYNTYVKYHNSDLLLKREMANPLIASLREKNHLTNLSVDYSPITDILPDFGVIKSGAMTKSEVKMTFQAVSDNSAYNFMEDLERKLPGLVVIKEIKIARTGDPSRAMILDLNQHKLAPLISGELTFYWLGIGPANPDKQTSPSPASPSLSPFTRGLKHVF